METLHEIRERQLTALSSHGIETSVLYEVAGHRWACLGWKSYGGGQGVDFVRQDGDYQVGDLNRYAIRCLFDEGILCQANADWISEFNFGYTRIIVVEINGWGMRILRVSGETDRKYRGTPIPADLRNADCCEPSPNPDEFIPFACFYRINDTHLEPEHRKFVEPEDLWPVKDGR